MVNRTLGALLRVKNINSWDKCLSFLEFAYNRAIHSTTHCSSFEIVYGFNPLTPLDLLPIPSNTFVSKAATSKTYLIKILHKEVRRELRNNISKLLEELITMPTKLIFRENFQYILFSMLLT